MPSVQTVAIVAGGVFVVGAAMYAYRVGPKTAAAVGNAINPVNPDNIFAAYANEVVRAVTGNQVDTLGTSLAAGYSDRVGAEIVAPLSVEELRARRAASDSALILGSGGYVGDLPLASDPYIGPGGAVFGVYPKP